MTEEVSVSTEFIEKAFSKIACGTLDMHDPTCSIAETFLWRGKVWIAVSGVSSEFKPKSVTIREVVPAAFWEKPFNDINARGKKYYLGGRFSPPRKRHQTWVITERIVVLRPDPSLSKVKPVQLSFA